MLETACKISWKMDYESEGDKMKINNNVQKILGLVNILLMLKEPITILINNEYTFRNPDSILFSSKTGQVCFYRDDFEFALKLERIKNITIMGKDGQIAF
jgi:hypothetical protein